MTDRIYYIPRFIWSETAQGSQILKPFIGRSRKVSYARYIAAGTQKDCMGKTLFIYKLDKRSIRFLSNVKVFAEVRA